ncbi:MAG: hypothetical protein BWY06_02683 [Candidatus Latescibacteria bacterium ADurb.Bin168]|nr:MAG: hypothetical protein BWY06_02683 [Candidatus Latescibacteria bacterium ADurb.Bin168]
MSVPTCIVKRMNWAFVATNSMATDAVPVPRERCTRRNNSQRTIADDARATIFAERKRSRATKLTKATAI